jgi:hypothetical protein
MRKHIHVVAAISAALVTSEPLRAQAIPVPVGASGGVTASSPRLAKEDRLAVVLILVDRMPGDGGDAVIVRGAGRANPNTILLTPAGASPERLAAAMTLLKSIIARDGDLPGAGLSYVPVPSDARAFSTPLQVATGMMRLLSRQPIRYVPDVGQARALTIYVPNAEGRRKLGR